MAHASDQPDLEVLFLDFDAFFAGVEQMDRPELRGRPIVVTPTPGPSGCCITASYEARAYGIKTGIRAGEAMELCPEVTIVRSRANRYIQVHHELVEAIGTAMCIESVDSVDELWGRLLANERSRPEAERIARNVKRAIREQVGPITCSIGIAPNRLIAKVAGGMQKPDGLTVIGRSELPGPLLELSLTDLPGISTGINRRLRAKGITTIEDLYNRSKRQLREAWGSVNGEYWYHWIRGDHLLGPKTRRQTIGHQHVLSPQYRAHDKAWGVAVRLLSKAAQRMRREGYVASRLSLVVRYTDRKSWGDWAPLGATADTVEMYETLVQLWRDAPVSEVLMVGVTLMDLSPPDSQMPLFEGERNSRQLWAAIDKINARYGVDKVYIATMHGQKDAAPRRIPFGRPPDLRLADVDE
ncbi:MAG: DNA polymerase IV [Phycisphaerales bacterium]